MLGAGVHRKFQLPQDEVVQLVLVAHEVNNAVLSHWGGGRGREPKKALIKPLRSGSLRVLH